jgi:hypothetical protein
MRNRRWWNRLAVSTSIGALTCPAAAQAVGGCCGQGGSCYEAWGGNGCNDEECCKLVTALDPFCCSVQWDQICANEAVALCLGCPAPPDCTGATPENEPCGEQINGGPNKPGDLFTFIDCGETVCGTIWKTQGVEEDDDWYLFEVPPEGSHVTVTVEANFPVLAHITSSPGGDTEISNCGATIDICLAGGSHTIRISASLQAIPCPDQFYKMTVACEPMPCDADGCGGTGEGSCFAPHGPFCNDAACCGAVCAVQPWCCSSSWDFDCAMTAYVLCMGGEAPPNNDCANAIDVGEGWTPVNNFLATTDGVSWSDCPTAFGPNNVFNDLWYRYTPTASGLATITSCGSVFPEKVAVYAGCECGLADEPVACMYRPCPPEGVICIPVNAGECYLIRIGGLQSSDVGLTELQISLDQACDASPACPNPSHGCFDGGGPGCSDSECCAMICDQDWTCCDHSWDYFCIQTALMLCGQPPCKSLKALRGAILEPERCDGLVNEGCGLFADCTGPSTCCEPHFGVPGCSDSACAAAVCMIEPYCCDASWYEPCTWIACSLDEFCDCDPAMDPSNAFTPLACGDTVFGSAFGTPTRSFDWYRLTVDRPGALTVCVSAEFPGVLVVDPPDCGTESYGGVPFTSCVDGCFSQCLEAGDYYVAVIHAYDTPNPCGSELGNDYILTVSCAGSCDAPANDACVDAISVSQGQTSFESFFATADEPIVSPACGIPAFNQQVSLNGVWFEHIAECTGTLTIDTCGSGFDSALSVFSGAGCDDLAYRFVGCSVDDCGPNAKVSIVAERGDTFTIRVSGHPTGKGVLSISCSPDSPPTPDLNGDGVVDGADLGLLLASWDTPDADLNGDGTTDGADLGLLLASWTS